MNEELYDLTNPQKSIWLTEQFYKGSAINTICGTVHIDKKIDFEKLNIAINTFLRDNDAFRIRLLIDESGNVKQYFTKYVPIQFSIEEVLNNDELMALESQMATSIFNVIGHDLYNIKLFKFPNGKGGFIVSACHLVVDAHTASLIASKVINIYSALIKNEAPAESSTSYVDYINSEKEYLNGSKFEKDKEYWEEQFKIAPEFGVIPSLRESTTESCVGARELFNIPADTVERINTFCKNNKISMFNFLMAVYAIYIGRISNLDEFVIGTPILNRTTFAEKNTPGMFISTVPFKFTMSNSISFIEFVQKIGLDSLGMLRHQKYPYQKILEHIRESSPDQPNLYDILISYQNSKTNNTSSDVPYLVSWTFNNNVADSMQIHLFDMNDEGKLNVAYDYRVNKYSPDDINNIHNRILHIIAQILETPEILLNNIDVVTPKEKDLILNKFNNTFLEYDKSKTVVDYFEEQVEKTPNNTALVCNGKEFTYQKLNEEANKLAHYLVQNGVRHKDIIGIMVHRSSEMLIGLLAILKVGACYLPIDPKYPTDRISYILQNSSCNLVLVHKDTIKLINDEYKKIDISLDSPIYVSNEIQNLHVNILPHDLIYIIYTSGSTGNPKGVMLTHQNINNFINAEKQCINFSADKVMISVTTICFDIFALEIWCSLTSGIKVILATDDEQISPILLRELCQKYSVNMIQTTPSRFSTLLANANSLDFFSNFTDIMVGGEPFPQLLLEKLHKCCKANIFNMYGPTETTVWSTIKDLTNTSTITIGKPIANTTCYILDKNKKLLPPYVAGELYIGGNGVSNGYWKREELTNEKFISSPFKENETIYNTNDLAYFRKDGEIVLLGRTDFQVKIRGYRIELEEIENKIIKFPDVVDCVVNPIDNANKLCAYYISNKEIGISDLRNYLSKELPNYMLPNYFVRMASFPHTQNGKINRKALPLPEVNTYKEIVASRNEFDKYLVGELQKSLDLQSISITDSFFDIGGDSLTAINLCTKISNEYSIDFMVKDIFESPIIKEISDKIASRTKVDDKITLLRAEKNPYYHVSSAQKRVYYSSKMSGENSILYNMPGAIIFSKKPDIKKLNKCLKKLIEKNSSLRTCFKVIDNEVYQKVLDTVSFEVVEKTEKNKTVDEVVQEFVKPFNLAKAPLFRASLVTLKDKFLLLFDIHHIISDGLSLSILTRELCNLYNGNELTENKFQYVDYAEWEYKNLKENNMQESKNYWVNQFKNDIPALNLPTDYIRPAVQSFEGAKVYKTISNDLAKKINSLARKLDVSNYMLLLACYYILLSKYTGQEDIVIGTPVVGRTTEGLLNIIGMFVNSLPLKNHIKSSMYFNEFLKSVKSTSIEALTHQLYPFDELVSNLNITRDTSRNPIFDTMFTYQSERICSYRIQWY